MGLNKVSLILLFFLLCAAIPSKADYNLKQDKAKQIYNYKKDIEQLEEFILKNDF